jgi:hypothetical protein
VSRGNRSQGDITSVLTQIFPPPSQETKEELSPVERRAKEKKVAPAPAGDEDKEIIREFVMEKLKKIFPQELPRRLLGKFRQNCFSDNHGPS